MKDDVINKKGANYVKRMIERNKENSRSPVNRVQSIRTRIRIFESIQPNEISPESLKQSERRYSKKLNSSQKSEPKNAKRQQKNFSPPEVRSPSRSELLRSKNSQLVEPKFTRLNDSDKENLNPALKSPWDQDRIDQQIDVQSRFSVGRYFKAKSQEDLLRIFHNNLHETDEENKTAELFRRESKRFFSPRVLTTLEPEVAHQSLVPKSVTPNRRRCSDMYLVQETFEKNPVSSHDDSLRTEESDKTDSEERWKLQRNNVDGGLYQNFADALDKDFNVYSEKNFCTNQIVETPVRTFGIENATGKFINLTKIPTLEKSFDTAQDDTSPTLSFFQRNKPVHESTRKFNDKTNPSIGCTIISNNLTPPMSTEIYQNDRKDDPSPPADVKISTPIYDEVEANYMNTNEAYAISLDGRSNSCNITDLMSLEKTPSTHHEDDKKDPKTPSTGKDNKTFMSEASTKNTSRLQVTRDLCRSLTRKLTKSFLRHSKRSVSPTPTLDCTDLNPDRKQRYDELRKRYDVEEDRITQASKALETCKSSRRFISSQERVEAERFLILTSLTKRALSKEMSRFAYHDDEDDNLYCELGRITLGDFSLALREDQVRLRQTGNLVEWFIIVVRSGLVVWASHAVPCPMTSPLYFPGEVSIPDLGPDFRINITVYRTVLEQVVLSHEVKFGTQDAGGRKLKDKIFRKSPMRSLHQTLDKSNRKFSFQPCGNLEITLTDLKDSGPWELNQVPLKSVLQGKMRLKLKCDLQLSVTHAGFLTYASNAFLLSYNGEESPSVRAWNRRWCLLKGSSLQLWNYPDEQESHRPIFSIDLAKCVSEQVGLADRSICARNRTLIIETCWRRNDADCQTNCSHTRHFLCFDNSQELTEWQSKLNHVISSLQQWNVIRSSNELSIVSL